MAWPTQPPNIKRSSVVIVVRLSLFGAARFAGLTLKCATPDRAVGDAPRMALDRINGITSPLPSANCTGVVDSAPAIIKIAFALLSRPPTTIRRFVVRPIDLRHAGFAGVAIAEITELRLSELCQELRRAALLTGPLSQPRVGEVHHSVLPARFFRRRRMIRLRSSAGMSFHACLPPRRPRRAAARLVAFA